MWNNSRLVFLKDSVVVRIKGGNTLVKDKDYKLDYSDTTRMLEISFIKDRNIETNLLEKGYEEIICDEDFSYKSKLWFYGDVNTTEFE